MTFKKGDQVYAVKSWDGKGTVSIDRWTVTSWGRKQGTAIREESGKPITERIYVDRINCIRNVEWSPFLFLVDGTDDIEGEALKIAKAYITAPQNDYKADKMHEPRAAALDVLHAELMERLRVEKGHQQDSSLQTGRS